MKYLLDYVAVVACGEGSRLMPLTKDIPKFLVTLNNKSVLFNIIDYWKQYTTKFIIVTDVKYNILVKYYMDLFRVDYSIINISVKKGQENSYTIHNAFKSEEFVNKKILITWCDVYPASPIEFNRIIDKNIIFTYKNFSRYNAYNNKLIKEPNGNVAGIYYFSNFQNITIFDETMDICDCYSENFGDFITYELDNMIDIGDMDKLDFLIKDNQSFPIMKKVCKADLYNFLRKDIVPLLSYFSHITQINNTKFIHDINLLEDIFLEVNIEQIPNLLDICGFSLFENDEKFHFIIDNTNICININNKIESQIENILSFLDKKSKNLLCKSIIFHWFSLSYQYTLNIHKCISAYYYGFFLYNKYILL